MPLDEREPSGAAVADPAAGAGPEVSEGAGLGGEPTPPDTAQQVDPDAAAAVVEDQPPAPLPETWQDHPDAKTALEDRYNTGRGEREKQLRGEMERKDQYWQREIQASQNRAVSAQVVTDVSEKLSEFFDLDDEEQSKAFGTFLRKHGNWADVFNDARAEMARSETIRKVKGVIEKAGLNEDEVQSLRSLEAELAQRVRFGEIEMADALIELIEASYQPIKEVGRREEGERRDKLEREMGAATARHEERLEQSPPATPSGGGGGGAGSTKYRTKTAARALHVQNKITSDEMRRVNADPSIPEI